MCNKKDLNRQKKGGIYNPANNFWKYTPDNPIGLNCFEYLLETWGGLETTLHGQLKEIFKTQKLKPKLIKTKVVLQIVFMSIVDILRETNDRLIVTLLLYLIYLLQSLMMSFNNLVRSAANNILTLLKTGTKPSNIAAFHLLRNVIKSLVRFEYFFGGLILIHTDVSKFHRGKRSPQLDFFVSIMSELIDSDAGHPFKIIFINKFAIMIKRAVLSLNNINLCKWQFIYGLELWSRIISNSNHMKSFLIILNFLVQLMLGITRLLQILGSPFLCYQITKLLNRLAQVYDKYVPIIPILLKVIRSPRLLKLNYRKYSFEYTAIDKSVVKGALVEADKTKLRVITKKILMSIAANLVPSVYHPTLLPLRSVIQRRLLTISYRTSKTFLLRKLLKALETSARVQITGEIIISNLIDHKIMSTLKNKRVSAIQKYISSNYLYPIN
jgi:hypothetical protein